MEGINTQIEAVEIGPIVAALLARAAKIKFHPDEMAFFVAFFKRFEMSGPDRMLTRCQVVQRFERDLT